MEPEELGGAGPPREVSGAAWPSKAAAPITYYDQASGLVPLVSPVGRPVLLTIVGIYRALLDEIVRRDYNVLAARVEIPSRRKIAIMFKALSGRFTGAVSRLEGVREPQAPGDSIAIRT